MNVKEFPRRRKRLMDMMGDESIAIIPTASVHIRNRDVEFPFRPDSDFYYLTGYPEPVAAAVLIPGRNNGEFVLFCRERDAKMETWHGRRAGLEGACDRYGADDAFPIEDLDDILPGLLEGRERIYYTMGNDPAFDQRVVRWVKQVRELSRSGVHAPDEFISLTHLLHEMRLFKSREEIAAIRQAIRIAGQGHLRAMQVCRPGMKEYQIEAELVHEFMRQGARSPAYPPIVGSGANSCILHYTENTAELQAGDMLLIDAGAEYDCYASDITRSFPISGEFSREQALIYELVLAAQTAAIAQVKPGKHWNDPHEAAIAVITDGLIELGILRGTRKKLINEEAFTRYYMHRTGHWLGMDVHDVGEYKLDGEWRTLEPGMILTIEPGLYFQPARGLAKKWWNIGIRIEDDVLVTRTGHDVLSKHIPKDLAEIERLMA
ncbi:MAG TPA: Xaa-Pro aminopeptidase [Gammaproteobacteria bacterium]|nr:Xaa-Pro aminopeptidase [Gammaproteobacteria bacterium]